MALVTNKTKIHAQCSKGVCELRLFENALSIEIMEYLFEVREIHRKNLYLPFASYNYAYYARILKRLIDEGYITVFKKNRVNYIRLSDKGEKALIKKQVMTKDEAAQRKKQRQYAPRAKKREQLVSNVLILCEGGGFIIGDDKPPLEMLFTKKGHQSEKYENQFEDGLRNGMFYTSKEIRQAYIEVIGKSEIANWSRLVGIVFMGTKLTFVYSVGDTLIKWRSGSEDRTVELIRDFLIKSDCVKRNIENPKYPNCVICGKGMSMIPKIVIGRRWGRITDDEDVERFRAAISRDHINSHNLAKAFASAYYVPVNKNGLNGVRLACMMGEKEKEDACDRWFESVKGVTRIKSLPYHQGTAANGHRVVYMPYMDLIELDFYRKQGDSCHFVIPAGTQEAVSRVMGPLLLSAQSLKGTKLKYRRYDSKGAPADGSIWECCSSRDFSLG